MKTDQEITQKIINYIYNTNFSFEYDYTNNCINEKVKYGAYLLEFNVGYLQREKYYIASSYSQPEEATINFEPISIDEVNVYINNELQELNDEYYEEIKNALIYKIIE